MHLYTIAIVTVHICTITVARAFNILILFLSPCLCSCSHSHLTLSLSLLTPHLTLPPCLYSHLTSLSHRISQIQIPKNYRAWTCEKVMKENFPKQRLKTSFLAINFTFWTTKQRDPHPFSDHCPPPQVKSIDFGWWCCGSGFELQISGSVGDNSGDLGCLVAVVGNLGFQFG